VERKKKSKWGGQEGERDGKNERSQQCDKEKKMIECLRRSKA